VKKGKRAKHHHHRLEALLIQYSHLNAEQRADALEIDILALASMLEGAQAVRVLDKITAKLRVHR
jgi:hypothetical protein